jgi:TonB family protein
MFASLQNKGRTRRTGAQLFSVAAHAALVLFLTVSYHRSAVLIQPQFVAFGQRGAGHLTYVVPRGPDLQHAPGTTLITHSKLSLPSHKTSVTPVQHLALAQGKENNAPAVTPKAGSPYSTHNAGALVGIDIMPALPTIFPDPPIARVDIPQGITGDVVVEITIDERGNVIETRLLRGLGYGIEDKVITTLYQWHFRPAMRDGVAIPSKQDGHFHYPS